MNQGKKATSFEVAPGGGLAGWLLGRLRTGRPGRKRLAVLERIQLAPRQSLAMIEADGRVLLVATSPDGAPAFYPLDEMTRRPIHAGQLSSTARLLPNRAARISW
jgi:flagellar biogenesis protein FliO